MSADSDEAPFVREQNARYEEVSNYNKHVRFVLAGNKLSSFSLWNSLFEFIIFSCFDLLKVKLIMNVNYCMLVAYILHTVFYKIVLTFE